MRDVSPEVLERIQLWKPWAIDPRPEWYVWSGDWYEHDGKNTVATVWDVTADSVVLDVGGYQGRWAGEMVEKYDPIVHLFEPAPQAFRIAQERLRGKHKVHLHPFGVGATNETAPLGDCERDGASFCRDVEPAVMAEKRRFAEVLDELGIQNVDLMSLNIEGGEYELLAHLLDTGKIAVFRQMMIQWHWRQQGDEELQHALQARVAQTHRMMWNYGAWEGWERKVND